jgi:hypothetical protein
LHMQISVIHHHVPHWHAFRSSKISNLTHQAQHLLECFAQLDPVLVSYRRAG